MMVAAKRLLSVIGLVAYACISFPSAQAAPVTLANATAIRSQLGPPLLVTELIDGSINTNNGWGNDVGGNNTAVFETVTDLFSSAIPLPPGISASGGSLTFEIHSGGFNAHEIGRFRLSATTADRSTFADGLVNGGDVTTDWVVLTPLTFVSDNGGTTLTLQGDNSLLASGTPNTGFETYTVTVNTSLTDITGFRFEAISDPSLPGGLPGRASNGNFVVQEFIVSGIASFVAPEPASLTLLGLGSLVAIRRRRGRSRS
jgi:hypothetical protein